MRFFRLPCFLTTLAFGSLLSWADMGSFFEFVEPVDGSQWVNGQTNTLLWEKGLLDGMGMFDLELARASQDGLVLAALNVPSNAHQLGVYLQDVPAADDYYLLFINSTHGVMYAISPRFTILDAGSSVKNQTHTLSTSAATITVTGGPNPTAMFATTFPAISGAQAWRFDAGARSSALGIICASAGAFVGAAWTLL